MTTADYNAAIANLNTSMEAEVGAQIDANKAAIVDLFPILARLLIGGILWPCLLKIGRVIGAALVGLMLKKLGQMTLADVAELINKYLSNAKMPPMELGHGLAYMGEPKTRPVLSATEVRAILDAAYSPSARLTLTIETPRS